MVSKDLLKGTLKTIVLKLLEENGRMYGYEITREVERLTEGKVQLSWGKSRISSASILTGSFCLLRPRRAERRLTWVSTTTPCSRSGTVPCHRSGSLRRRRGAA